MCKHSLYNQPIRLFYPHRPQDGSSLLTKSNLAGLQRQKKNNNFWSNKIQRLGLNL